MSYHIIAAAALVLYLCSFYYNYFRRRIRGPIPIPILNNLPQLLQKKKLPVLLDDYHSIYGNFVHIDPPLGNKPILSITDPTVISEIYSTSSTSQYDIRLFPTLGIQMLDMAYSGIA